MQGLEGGKNNGRSCNGKTNRHGFLNHTPVDLTRKASYLWSTLLFSIWNDDVRRNSAVLGSVAVAGKEHNLVEWRSPSVVVVVLSSSSKQQT